MQNQNENQKRVPPPPPPPPRNNTIPPYSNVNNQTNIENSNSSKRPTNLEPKSEVMAQNYDETYLKVEKVSKEIDENELEQKKERKRKIIYYWYLGALAAVSITLVALVIFLFLK